MPRGIKEREKNVSYCVNLLNSDAKLQHFFDICKYFDTFFAFFRVFYADRERWGGRSRHSSKKKPPNNKKKGKHNTNPTTTPIGQRG